MSRPKYLNYTTQIGVTFQNVAPLTASHFLLHVCGGRPQLPRWDHLGVDSPFWRLYHNRTPGGSLRYDGALHPLDPGELTLIPADTRFDCVLDRPFDHFFIHFSVPQTGTPEWTGPRHLTLDSGLRSMLESCWDRLREAPSPARDRALFHRANALLHLAFSALETDLPGLLPEPLPQLLQWIEANPDADLSTPNLARRSRMSLEAFHRWFRQHMDRTPANHVAATRLQLAQRALILTDDPIDQIAIDHGYANRHYFSRVFSRKMGCGPAEFRARQSVKRGR